MGQNQSHSRSMAGAAGLVAIGAAVGVTIGVAAMSRHQERKKVVQVQDNPHMDEYKIVPGSMDQADDAMRLVKKAEFVLRQRTQAPFPSPHLSLHDGTLPNPRLSLILRPQISESLPSSKTALTTSTTWL